MTATEYKAGSNLEKVLPRASSRSPASAARPRAPTAASSRRRPRSSRATSTPSTSPTTRPPWCASAPWPRAYTAQQNGLEAIMQMTCRDRNRLAMQADILGAATLGIKNILCLTGDHLSFGNHPQAKGVHDLDAINLIKMYKDMRDEKKFQCGDEMDTVAGALHRLRREPVRRPLRVPRPAPQEEDRGRRRLHADAVHLQHPQVQEVDGGGARPGPAQGDQDPRRHHAAQGRRRRALHAEVRARHGRAAGDRRPHGRRREGRRRRTPRARSSPSR